MGNFTTSNKLITGFSVALFVTTGIAIVFIVLYNDAIEDNSDALCNNSWVVDTWSDCDSTCGPSNQTRAVSCPVNITCNPDLKPETSRTCSKPACVWQSNRSNYLDMGRKSNTKIDIC